MTEEVKQRRSVDPELQTMAKVDRLLAELDKKQQERVVSWLLDKYGKRTVQE